MLHCVCDCREELVSSILGILNSENIIMNSKELFNGTFVQ